MSNERWQPVEDENYRLQRGMELQVVGSWLYAADGYTVIPLALPDDLRLCRRVEIDRPRADWSQAPEWAQYWAVDANGYACWYYAEPPCNTSTGKWEWKDNKTAVATIKIEIPLGIDWRMLIEQRPVAHND